MIRPRRSAGFTLAEVLVAMSGSVLVVGALLMASISMQKAFHASETYANSQADERRLIDYIARDCRRAIGLSAQSLGGASIKLAGSAARLDEGAVLTITLPAYYRSNSAADAEYDQPLPVIAAGDRVAYGTAAGPAPEFPIYFRKLFLAGEKCVCFVRDEGDTRQVIVRNAEDLQLQITVAANGESCAIDAQFRTTFSANRALVAVYDTVMLRNVRID